MIIQTSQRAGLRRISEFLKRNNTSTEAVSKTRLAQFEKVDVAIQTRLAEIRTAQALLKGNHINVSTISADTNISRKTFYNNDLLRVYVEEHTDACIDESGIEAEVERLRGRCEALERQVQQFLLRDLSDENLRHENMRLQVEIQNLERRNKNLEQQYEVVQNEVSRLQKQVSYPKSAVLPFNKK